MSFDAFLINLIGALRNPVLDYFMLLITDFGATVFISTLSVVAGAVFFWRKKYNHAAFLLLSVFGGEAIGIVIKHAVERARPDILAHLIESDGFSFPSGHTLNTALFCGSLIVIAASRIKNNFLKKAVIIFLLAVIFMIGFSRIYLGVHWPSDVLGSLALGAIWVTIVSVFLDRFRIIKWLRNKLS